MSTRLCECTANNHTHTGVCEKIPYSQSFEHNNSMLCKECYDEFIRAKQAVIDFQQNLMMVAMQQPDKLRDAQNSIAKILSGGKS